MSGSPVRNGVVLWLGNRGRTLAQLNGPNRGKIGGGSYITELGHFRQSRPRTHGKHYSQETRRTGMEAQKEAPTFPEKHEGLRPSTAVAVGGARFELATSTV